MQTQREIEIQQAKQSDPIRLSLQLADFQVLVAGGVTTHIHPLYTVQIILSDIGFGRMYKAIDTACEMVGRPSAATKADLVTTKMFEVIENMLQVLVMSNNLVHNLAKEIPLFASDTRLNNMITHADGLFTGISELVDDFRKIMKPDAEGG